MIIEGPDFKMESSISDEDTCFDLQLLQYVNSKTNPRDEFKLSGYGISFEGCVKRIINNRIARRHKTPEHEDSPMTLEEYVKDFHNTMEEIKQLLYGNSLPERR